MKEPTQEDLAQFVRNNVVHCVSALVATLANGHGDIGPHAGDLSAVCEQAFELSSPVEDYEEAARQADYVLRAAPPDGEWHAYQSGEFVRNLDSTSEEDAWRELCDAHDIDPYQWEIYEHWIISDPLADALERHGERVDKDFAGLCVWGRTTTGQAISLDSVIERIWRELHREDPT